MAPQINSIQCQLNSSAIYREGGTGSSLSQAEALCEVMYVKLP